MADLIITHWKAFLDVIVRSFKKRLLLSCGAGVILLNVFYRAYCRRQLIRKLTTKQQQLAERLNIFRESISRFSNSAPDLLPLSNMDLDDLRKGLDEQKFTPIDLLHAFQLKALNLFDQGNAGICEFIQEAEAMFSEISTLDENIGTESNRSPLYGIPVSVDESFCVNGYDSTLGIIKRCGVKNTEDCVLIKVLRRSGAIPFVLTSTSQGHNTIDGVNFIFGNTVNPLDRLRLCGGGSCGAAALLAQRGAPIGIGSDIGGGVRVPAAFCALAALKPTVHRLSHIGMVNITQHATLLLGACPGIMGRKVDDLVNTMRTLLTPIMFDLDPQVVPLPFNDDVYNGTTRQHLNIGVFSMVTGDFISPTVPSVRTAVFNAQMAILDAGHHIYCFEPPSHSKVYQLYLRCIFADGGKELRAWMLREPVGTQLRFLLTFLSLPYWLKSVCDVFAKFAFIRPMVPVSSLHGLRDLQAAFDLMNAVREYRSKFQKQWAKHPDMDAVICPVSAFPAPVSNIKPIFITPSLFYTALYNLLDYPAGVVSMGCVDQTDISHSAEVTVQRRINGDWYTSQLNDLQRNTEGLNLSVQVVSKPYHEEVVLRVMRILESCNNR